MVAQLFWRADAAFATRARCIRARCIFRLFECFPDVGSPRRVLAETIMMAERVAEEAEAIEAAAARFGLVTVHRKTRHHADIGIHRMADRRALLFEDAIVVVDPLLGLRRIDKREGEGT